MPYVHLGKCPHLKTIPFLRFASPLTSPPVDPVVSNSCGMCCHGPRCDERFHPTTIPDPLLLFLLTAGLTTPWPNCNFCGWGGVGMMTFLELARLLDATQLCLSCHCTHVGCWVGWGGAGWGWWRSLNLHTCWIYAAVFVLSLHACWMLGLSWGG